MRKSRKMETKMNEEDKFEARHQEIVDAYTGTTITLGSHVGGTRWLRIAVRHRNPADPMETGDTKTSTITFGPDGQVLNIQPHVVDSRETTAAPPVEEAPEDPRAVEIKEELAHLDEIEHDLHVDTEKVDKPAKKSKK